MIVTSRIVDGSNKYISDTRDWLISHGVKFIESPWTEGAVVFCFFECENLNVSNALNSYMQEIYPNATNNRVCSAAKAIEIPIV